MRTRAKWLVLLTLLMVAGAAAASDGVHNVVISDGDSGFFVSCSEVRIYALDPDSDARLSEQPTLALPHPNNPIQINLDPGRYELVIWMFYLPFEVHYLSFDVTEDGVNLVDLSIVDFPEELVTY